MKTKVINSQTMIEFFCYLLFAGMTLYLLLSGKYLSYVTPRMKPYLYFAVAVMLLWAVFALSGLFRPQRRKRIAHCFVLIIPVLLLLLPHGEVGISTLSGAAGPLTGSALHSLAAPKGAASGGKPGGALGAAPPLKQPASSDESSAVSGASSASASSPSEPASPTVSGGASASSPSESASPAVSGNASASSPSEPASPAMSGSASASSPSESASPAVSGAASAPTPSASKAPAAPKPAKAASPGVYESSDVNGQKLELHGYDRANRAITVRDDEFYGWLSEFSKNLASFEGYQITITGAVYKDSDYFASNEFIPARLMMTCCTADLAPTGLVCEYAKTPGLEAGSWVTVTGTLYKGQYEGDEEPQLKVSSIAPAQPVKGYVYPF